MALGKLQAQIVGGTDGVGGGDGPAVVLLHGFGAPGDDLVPLAQELSVPRGTRFIFPEAPLALQGFGDARAWWLIDVERWQRAMLTGNVGALTQEVPAGLAEARAAVDTFLDAVERELGVDPKKLVLGGFSQGAMLSTDVCLRGTRPLAGLLIVSGALIAESEWVPRMPSRQRLRVFQSHGSADPILPLFVGEQLGERMRSAGLAHTFLRFPGGHGIPREVLAGIERALVQMLPE